MVWRQLPYNSNQPFFAGAIRQSVQQNYDNHVHKYAMYHWGYMGGSRIVERGVADGKARAF